MLQFILGAIGVVAISELSKKRSSPKMENGGVIIRNEENKRLYDEIVALAESIDVDYATKSGKPYENTREYSMFMDNVLGYLYELDNDDYKDLNEIYENIGAAEDTLYDDVIRLVEDEPDPELGEYRSPDWEEDFFTDTDYAKDTIKLLREINEKLKILEKKVRGEMAIGGLIPTAPNGEEFAEGGRVGSLKISKQSDGKYYWTFTFSDGKTEKSFEGFNTPADAQRDFQYRSKYFAKGGKIERVYIDYLNKEKNFKRDRKYFDSYEEAKKWASKNFDRFNSDMINYEYAKGGTIEPLEKELIKLQRELNSRRLSTYTEGDTSEEEMARRREREIKLARFNEILKLLNEKDREKLSKGGSISLETFDINELDAYEKFTYNDMLSKNPKMSKSDILRVIINNVDGDYSQLSPKLSKVAKKIK